MSADQDSRAQAVDAPPVPPAGAGSRLQRRLELYATVLLAIATLLTAWSAFQSAKWSGLQAIEFSSAAAARTESTRASTQAGQETAIRVTLFTQWLQALDAERRDTGADIPSPYEPEPGTLSGFIYDRFPAEFAPAVQAWLATDPLDDADAPSSPFVMPEYRLAADTRAAELIDEADRSATEARAANQTSDNYVLTTVLFASVLFFAGVSSKAESRRISVIYLTLAALLLVSGMGILASFPIEV